MRIIVYDPATFGLGATNSTRPTSTRAYNHSMQAANATVTAAVEYQTCAQGSFCAKSSRADTASDATVAEEVHGFFRLPAETRLQIFAHAYEPASITCREGRICEPGGSSSSVASSIMVNKQYFYEAAEHIAATHEFTFKSQVQLIRFLSKSDTTRGLFHRHIRHITLECGSYTNAHPIPLIETCPKLEKLTLVAATMLREAQLNTMNMQVVKETFYAPGYIFDQLGSVAGIKEFTFIDRGAASYQFHPLDRPALMQLKYRWACQAWEFQQRLRDLVTRPKE